MRTPNNRRGYLLRSEAAKIVGCSLYKLRQYIAEGAFPEYAVGGMWIIPRKPFLEWHNRHIMEKARQQRTEAALN